MTGDGLIADSWDEVEDTEVRAPSRRTGVVALAVLLLVVVALGVLVAVPGLAPAGTTEDVNPARIGTLDQSYNAPGVQAPTGRKTEAAKLVFVDGTWWGILFWPSRDAFTINRFDTRRNEWIDTGTVIDDRNGSQADILWDGSHLYGISGGTDPASDEDGAMVFRMSYDAGGGTWKMDRGFPVAVSARGSEMFTLAKDSAGRLWATWTADQAVWIAHSDGDDKAWTLPEVLPAEGSQDLSPDDISAVVAYDGGVGIMWSDQTEGEMRWASAPAGSETAGPWSVTSVVKGPAMADDHMNLKALHDDPAGLVFAAVKTSRNDLPSADPSDPLIMLMILRHDGTWSRTVVSTVRQNETRPLLLIDQDHRQLYVLTSAPCCAGGTIYLRSTALDDIGFDAGSRRPVLRRGRSSTLNNAASSKAPLTAESGMLVVASDDNVRSYMHAWIPLTGDLVAKPPAAPGGGGSTGARGEEPTKVVASDDFETGNLDKWTVATGPTPGSTVTADPGGARSDRYGMVLNADSRAEAFAYARLKVPEGPPPFGLDLDFNVEREGLPDGNVPLVRLLRADGTRILWVYRQNGGSGQLWIRTESGRETTLARAEASSWTHLELTLTDGGDTAFADLWIDGRLVGQASLPIADARVALVQVGNDTAGQPFRLLVDNVRIRR